ncbi:hypothetical protein M5D96_010639 [Drosophila gunungcola]|uniref:Uncharacterized protein n=1 Tax=Drosophila gunungcola TaxID=103775 RepID=A0A9P9YGW5_9MUSC|nr:hypothetical protein M5D96_010639 [Drosophila gunungcola]
MNEQFKAMEDEIMRLNKEVHENQYVNRMALEYQTMLFKITQLLNNF